MAVAIGVISFIWWRQRPMRVVEEAAQKLVEAQTQRFSSVVKIENSQATKDILGEQATVELAVDGVYARQKDARDSVDAHVVLTTKTESVTLLVEGNIKFIGDKAYFEITKAPLAFPALVQLKGMWVEIPRGAGVADSKLKSDEKLFTEVKRGRTWEGQGKKARVYQVTATRAAVILTLDGIAKILGTHLSDAQIGSIRDGIASTDTVPVEMAIAPWQRELYQIKTATKVPGNNNNVSVEINFSDRDKKVEIAVPEGARKLEDLATPDSQPSRQ